MTDIHRLKLLPRGAMKAKSLTRLPKRVLGSGGVLVVNADGVITITLDPDYFPDFSTALPFTAGELLVATGETSIGGVTGSSTVGHVLRVTGPGQYGWGAVDLADADAITGNLPVANLNNGTGAGLNTFLRGDGTWAEAGGGSTPETFGAAGDGIRVSSADVSVGAGGTTLVVADANFATDVAGKVISIEGAGTAGAYHTTTIASRTNATTVELTDVAVTALTNDPADVVYGTDDTDAFTEAATAIRAGTVQRFSHKLGRIYIVMPTLSGFITLMDLDDAKGLLYDGVHSEIFVGYPNAVGSSFFKLEDAKGVHIVNFKGFSVRGYNNNGVNWMSASGECDNILFNVDIDGGAAVQDFGRDYPGGDLRYSTNVTVSGRVRNCYYGAENREAINGHYVYLDCDNVGRVLISRGNDGPTRFIVRSKNPTIQDIAFGASGYSTDEAAGRLKDVKGLYINNESTTSYGNILLRCGNADPVVNDLTGTIEDVEIEVDWTWPIGGAAGCALTLQSFGGNAGAPVLADVGHKFRDIRFSGIIRGKTTGEPLIKVFTADQGFGVNSEVDLTLDGLKVPDATANGFLIGQYARTFFRGVVAPGLPHPTFDATPAAGLNNWYGCRFATGGDFDLRAAIFDSASNQYNKITMTPLNYNGGTDGAKFLHPNNTGHAVLQVLYDGTAGNNLGYWFGSNSFIDTAGAVQRYDATKVSSAININGVSGIVGAYTGGTGTNPTLKFSIGTTGITSFFGTTTDAAFQVDGSVASSGTGIKVTSSAAASGAKLAAISTGTNESLLIDAKGSGGVDIATTSTGNINLRRTSVVTSTSASALTVGRQGATDPVLAVDASAGSVATGIKVTGAAAASRAAVSVISSGTNEGLSIDAKGSGTIRFGATSTGAIEFSRNLVPTASDGAALGTTSLMFSDLFLASGAVLNFNNGDVTVTHSTDTLTIAGGAASTSTSTGALVISGSGGLGVGGDIHAANFRGGAWATWSPTISSQGGSGLTTTVNSARYCLLGKLVTAYIDYTITAVGTAVNGTTVTMPTTPQGGGSGFGRETAVSGYLMNGAIDGGSATAVVVKYDNSSPIGLNHRHKLTFIYETS